MTACAETYTLDFSTQPDPNVWQFVGSPYVDATGRYLVLTNNQVGQANIIWLNKEIKSDFTASFRYKNSGGGDGMVFMFYKDRNYQPGCGGSLAFRKVVPWSGYGQPVEGYGIEFDTVRNTVLGDTFNDPSTRHIALIEDDTGNHLKYVNDARTGDDQWHNVRISVTGGQVTVNLDNQDVLTWSGTFDQTFGGIGVGAATGTSKSWQIIDDLQITDPTVALPDLSISSSDLTFSNENPVVQDTITITARVHNGPTDVNNVVVRCLDGYSLIQEKTISLLKNSYLDETFLWTPTASGVHPVTVVIDPDNQLHESNRGDNVAVRNIDVSEAPDIHCNSCADCNSKISAASPGDWIYLDSDIGTSGSCILFQNKNDITFICNDHKITGQNTQGSYGIRMENGANNVINKCRISSFYQGISLAQSANNVLMENNLEENAQKGIYLDSSDNNHIYGNTVSNSGAYFIDGSYTGIHIYASKSATLAFNHITKAPKQEGLYVDGFGIDKYLHAIDTTNTINGKPIYYYGGNSLPCPDGQTLSFDSSSQVAHLELVGCNNLIIRNYQSINSDAIYLIYTDDSTVENCVSEQNHAGLNMYQSMRNQINNNKFQNNYYWGIGAYEARYNSYAGNVLNDNKGGIYAWNSDNGNLNGNEVCGNSDWDIYFQYQTGNTGANNKCDKTAGWDDESVTGCTVTCDGVSKLLPDLAIYSSDIVFSVSPAAVKLGESSLIFASVHNIGKTSAKNVVIKFYNGEQTEGNLIGQSEISEITPWNFETSNPIEWMPNAPGKYLITVVVDPDNVIPEEKENNNLNTGTLEVYTKKVLVVSVYHNDESEGNIVAWEVVYQLNENLDKVNDYFLKQSYGNEYINFIKWPVKIQMSKNRTQYINPTGDDTDFKAYEDELLTKIGDIAGYDVIFIFGTVRMTGGTDSKNYPSRAVNRPFIFMYPTYSYKTYSHELGHAIFEFPDLYVDKYGFHNGDIDLWGLMGAGDHAEPIAPLNYFNKVGMGWLINDPIDASTFIQKNIPLVLLENTPYKSKIANISLSDRYFMIEARSPFSGITSSDQMHYDFSSGVVVYQIFNQHPADKIDNSYSLPYYMEVLKQSDSHEATLSKGNPNPYIHPVLGITFNCIKGVCKDDQDPTEIEVKYDPFGLKDTVAIIVRSGIELTNAIYSMHSFNPNDTITLPDLDLHAYTPEGWHVGMNYTLGIYENQIPGAIASGDMIAEEWIFVPNNVSVRWVVDSRDVQEYLKQINSTENISLNYSYYEMRYGPNPSVELVNGSIVILGRNVTEPVNKTIDAGVEQVISVYTTSTTTSSTTTSTTTTSTTSTTSTTIPSSKVYGHIVTSSQLFVPYASVTVDCVGTEVSVSGNADSRGSYIVDLACPYGSRVAVSAESGPVNICLMPTLCLPYRGGSGSGEGVISSAGYALVNVPLK